MAKVKLKTLTSVHVGSGRLLQNNLEFLNSDDGEKLYILDDQKILQFIGNEHLDDWLLSIHKKERTSDLVKRFSPQSTLKDYSKRSLDLFADVIPSDTLKEHIRNGMGNIYIPGSSIKGAIRTAIMSTIASEMNLNEKDIIVGKKRNRNGEMVNLYGASELEKEIFGKNPNSDVFRFLRVGDAHFAKGSEIATRLVMYLNIIKRENLVPDSDRKPQLVEAIRESENSIFSLTFDCAAYELSKSKVHSMPGEMKSLETLFTTINDYTKAHVKEEIDYWKEVSSTKTGAEDYLDKLDYILEEIESCEKGKSCVLRLGHASGWDFITGGWSRNLDCFNDVVVPASRPNNKVYTDYDFPKSRRAEEDASLLGFVKLEIQ